jgi:hypothetical protein
MSLAALGGQVTRQVPPLDLELRMAAMVGWKSELTSRLGQGEGTSDGRVGGF